VIGDRLPETPTSETLFVNLSGALGGPVITDFQGQMTIQDNDPNGLAVNPLWVVEGNDAVATVTLSPPATQDVTVMCQWLSGTAMEGVDYQTPFASVILLKEGKSSGTCSTSTFADTFAEAPETFTVHITSVDAPIAYADATGTIVDRVAGSDFNNDRNTDLLWRNDDTGDTVVWYLQGSNYSGGGFTTPQNHGLNWKPVGTGYFPNGTPEAWDILWRDDTGNLELWRMNTSATAVSSVATSPANPGGVQWLPVATGEFNGDGKSDILFRNIGSGEIVVWLMNGNTRASGTYTEPPSFDPNWQIEGTGDLNLDGKTDLVWRHPASGELVVWFMGGSHPTKPPELTLAGGQFFSPESFDPGGSCRIEGTRDFNGDGKTDILWRHTTPVNPPMALWYMEGNILRSGVTLNLPAVNIDWKIVGPR
jgi:hypothetical protein